MINGKNKKRNQLDKISIDFRKKIYLNESQMSKYNSREAEKYFQSMTMGSSLELVQDIKRWLTETVNHYGVDASDDLLKQLKSKINKISKDDY